MTGKKLPEDTKKKMSQSQKIDIISGQMRTGWHGVSYHLKRQEGIRGAMNLKRKC